MAISFNIPSSPKKQVYQSSTFLGADFTSEASVVDDTKSPNCDNMIRSVPGKIRKRMGYEEVRNYQQPIFGVHYYATEDVYLVHAGGALYNMSGKNGRQWIYAEELTRANSDELRAYYKNILGNSVTIVPSGNNLTSYAVWDQNRMNNPPGAMPEVLDPPPAPYNSNYEFDKAEKQAVSVVTINKKTYWIYCWKYFYRLREALSYDVVDHNESHFYLLDGDVENTLISDKMAFNRSVSFELNHKLLILDGENAWLYSKEGLEKVTDNPNYEITEDRYSHTAYIPTVTILKDPIGQTSEDGNKSKDPLNLATAAYIEQFYVDENHASAKRFQMSFAPLDTDARFGTFTRAWVRDANGEWQEKDRDVDFTVDAEEGIITFTTAPGHNANFKGEDNVRIQAYRTVEGYTDRINHCTIGAMFGINGAHDRIFISGNPDSGENEDGDPYTYINCDWWCGMYDPTYWPDLSYSKLGSDTSAIMGYSIINNYLAAHKDYREITQSVIIREGDLVDDEPTFKIINSLQGAGAVSKYCFSYLATEPVFLTKLGIYAITAQDITGEKYAQDRSYYLEGKLLKEEGLEKAFAYSWKDYYILAINDHLYILDGLQPMHTDRSRPYATRQYAGFYFTNIPASCFFEIGDELYFGSMDGKIYKFYSDEKSLQSYNDNGEPISAVWETADIDEKLFYKKKTYRYLAVRCLPEISSSIKIMAQKEGQWTEIKDDQSKLKYFSYASLQYSKLTYSTNTTQKISATKIRLKKLDHVRFKFVNDRLNEPLGINDFAVEYTQAGNVK
jgi:hypothetical protein